MIACPKCGERFNPDTDQRAALWRVRVRLYADSGPDEPEADSDPDFAPDMAGETVLRGLPAVAEHVRFLAQEFHSSSETAGLEIEVLLHRLKGLRPTLSRRGGNGVWRVPYQVDGAGEWLARVDVQRVDGKEETRP